MPRDVARGGGGAAEAAAAAAAKRLERCPRCGAARRALGEGSPRRGVLSASWTSAPSPRRSRPTGGPREFLARARAHTHTHGSSFAPWLCWIICSTQTHGARPARAHTHTHSTRTSIHQCTFKHRERERESERDIGSSAHAPVPAAAVSALRVDGTHRSPLSIRCVPCMADAGSGVAQEKNA